MKLIATLIQFDGKQRLTTSHVDLAHELERLQADEHFRTTCLQAHHELISDPISSSKMLIGGSKSWKMKKTNLDIGRWDTFMSEYYLELSGTWSPETHNMSLLDTYATMQWAIIDGKFGKDSVALKNTCKVLKIKHTYKAIQTYLEGK